MTPSLITCPVCGYADSTSLGKRSDFYSAEQLPRDLKPYVEDVDLLVDREIRKCSICGFQFVSPPYGERELAALYNFHGFARFNEVFSPVRDFESSAGRAFLDYRKEKHTSLGVLAWREVFEKTHKRKPRFLDVGCGRGQHLVVYSEMGFQVSGIDVSHIQIEWIKDRLDFDVRQGTIDDLGLEERFDCILVGHVIEHVQSPTAFMRRLASLLESDGILIIETPVLWDWGVTEQRYRDIYHTQFFDHFTLVLLAARHGMRLQNSINITRRDDLRSDVYLLASFIQDESLTSESLSRSHIANLRAAYDAMFKDFRVWGRYYIQNDGHRERSLPIRAWKFWRSHGFIATVKGTFEFLRQRIVDRTTAGTEG
ncbi:MAG: class I SAM-dependent methyltransferase [Desulfomonile tiedjei]|nr:class I SAM-dependent methyltransferase [Desulfomonile tiedjei]